VTRLPTAGASVPEIAGVTGHSLMDVASILDGHYLGQRTALAEAVIRKLEKSERTNRSKTNLQVVSGAKFASVRAIALW
jgi:hypothetical protein